MENGTFFALEISTWDTVLVLPVEFYLNPFTAFCMKIKKKSSLNLRKMCACLKVRTKKSNFWNLMKISSILEFFQKMTTPNALTY